MATNAEFVTWVEGESDEEGFLEACRLQMKGMEEPITTDAAEELVSEAWRLRKREVFYPASTS